MTIAAITPQTTIYRGQDASQPVGSYWTTSYEAAVHYATNDTYSPAADEPVVLVAKLPYGCQTETSAVPLCTSTPDELADHCQAAGVSGVIGYDALCTAARADITGIYIDCPASLTIDIDEIATDDDEIDDEPTAAEMVADRSAAEWQRRADMLDKQVFDPAGQRTYTPSSW